MLTQEVKRHPHAFFARLRQQKPLFFVDNFFGTGAWIATDYADVTAILKDPRFIKDLQKTTEMKGNQEISGETAARLKKFAWRRDMLTTDPPDHTRLRHLVSKVFTPRMIEQLRSRIQQITDELLDAVKDQGHMDLVADFAFPLPITVISEMLGIPVADRQQFRTWTQALINMEESKNDEAYGGAMEAFIAYIKNLLAEKRLHPGEDLVSGLIQAEESGDKLNETELISMIFLLIVAGHETTVNLIGNGMLALFEYPEQMNLLRNDPSLLPSAVEELLRYTSPVTLSSPRLASEDILIHDQLIHKGEMVFVVLVSANSDPQQFTDPELLDITRQENQHVAFGKGIHFCLGAPLARLEGQVAFGALLQRFPDLRMNCEPEQLRWTPTFSLRSLNSLPVAF
ncbi:cytochrome P450 [Ktedonosporobacter rubrisoli]|uniref:Cytochrome P450 n=2 Tax=Ktedonosporobacter rubrisoli TaxID=2509675 RepID=A0A4P6K578_KTERU|nr:cytochrome P450 [Ktedonosporobacter rubrisoli]